MRGLWVLALSLLLLPGNAYAQQKPNIVLVLMDNLGWGEPGVYGGGILRGAPTPRIDQLAAEGMRLLNFNVEAQCTPSRAALMTGRYAIRTGNGSVPIDTPVYGLVQWEITMAEMLSDAGYATGAFGKWHLGHTEGRFPTDQGFDEWYGIPNSTDEAFWPDSARFRPDFPGCEVRAVPRPAETFVSGRKLGPVIGREDEDRVVADSKFVHRIEQLTDVRIDLGQNIGEIAVMGLVLKVRRGNRWHVRLRIGNVGEERFLRLRLPIHEIDRVLS